MRQLTLEEAKELTQDDVDALLEKLKREKIIERYLPDCSA